jgi:hypothetical protein
MEKESEIQVRVVHQNPSMCPGRLHALIYWTLSNGGQLPYFNLILKRDYEMILF